MGPDIAVSAFKQHFRCWLESFAAETTASDKLAPTMLNVRFSKSTI